MSEIFLGLSSRSHLVVLSEDEADGEVLSRQREEVSCLAVSCRLDMGSVMEACILGSRSKDCSGDLVGSKVAAGYMEEILGRLINDMVVAGENSGESDKF